MTLVSDQHKQCSFPMRPDAIAMSDCCRKHATSVVLRKEPTMAFLYRCNQHDGQIDANTLGESFAEVPAPPREPGSSTLWTVDIDYSPYTGYDTIEKFGEPFDRFLAGIDAEGTSCKHCGEGVGGYTYDTWPDEGHRMGFGWRWLTLVADEQGNVWPLCEPCSMTLTYQPCGTCNGSRAVPAGGGESPEAVDNGYVACPSCVRKAEK